MKTKVIYSCQQCGSQYPKWQGQCSGCGDWNSLTEEVSIKKPSRSAQYAGVNSNIVALSEVATQVQPRLATGFAEFDHVLGGGLVNDAVILIGGDPGIGKSTLLLQVLAQVAKDLKPLYVTGEESLQQIALRAERLQIPRDDLLLLAETNVERILAHTKQYQPKLLVIDSIQTMYTDLVTSASGSVSQVRESTAQLLRYTKQHGIVLVLVGHVTKEGALAGPRVLEHMVDTVLYFEGSSDSRFRMIRAVKNRFGAVNELGVFAMTDKGLKQVSNPSAIFLSGFSQDISGSSIIVTWEGSRPLLVEVQALVDESQLGNPRRVTVGLEQNRLSMLLAVLHRHGGISMFNQDVFVNVVGGLRISETAADLAIIMAVLSSLRNRPLPKDLVVFGEVGLGGEIRPVPSGPERLKEAVKHGFKRAIVPFANAPKQPIKGLKVEAVQQLSQALVMID
ncbi:MAG: DNA repair protein RadA [Gammaproteobacteria bacterium]|nr:DNA repair protein RadA [Gammaproteobacteria bacterium]